MEMKTKKYSAAKNRTAQAGLSLVELLVAISLGLFLTWGAIQAFIAGKQTYITQQAISQIQENGRIAQELLTYDLRAAGAYGCSSNSYIAGDPDGPVCNSPSVLTLNNSTKVEYNFGQAVFGADSVTAAAKAGIDLAHDLNPVPIAGTDLLVVKTGTDLGLELEPAGGATTLAADSPTLTTWNLGTQSGACSGGGNSVSGICVGDILALSDCARSKIFQVTALSASGGNLTITHGAGGGTPGNACATWELDGYAFPKGATIRKLNSVIYYVATSPTTGQPALYRKLLGQNAEELLSGVEDLQILYGLDENNDKRVDRFVKANEVNANHWSSWYDEGGDGMLGDIKETRVLAVRYSLLLRSDGQVLEKPQQYTYNGETKTATDRRLRQVLTSTVGLRSGLE